MGVIYWCVSKEFGEYLLMGWSGNRIVNGILKVTACAYRPWIRDARIIPDATAIKTATGYSFPSGHTMNAATTFGGGAVRRDLPKLLRALLFIMLVLVAFSRNFLGVHTPQDVVVGSVLGVLVMAGTVRLMAWLRAHPEKDIPVAAAGIGIAIAVAAYAMLKSYPADYDADGKLLVDGAKMALDTFKGVGYCGGFLIGWILERRLVRFTTDVPMQQRVLRAVAGLMGWYVLSLIVCPLIKGALSGVPGALIPCFLQTFSVVFLFPFIAARLTAKGTRPADA